MCYLVTFSLSRLHSIGSRMVILNVNVTVFLEDNFSFFLSHLLHGFCSLINVISMVLVSDA
jgi:hypothetical protein